ncbi:carboxypeptidase-like regulatory domain-containing protein [Tenacibaculum aestuariivivum]|uniref:carboxypeptidase-like regulatory domain-containing protein n=1 Tax=Tenacibaculum aestuariivivum TaxID=2006131 RepID=UPI003AB1EC6B
MKKNVHSISTIEGIGSSYEKLFNKRGILLSEDLIVLKQSTLKKRFKGEGKIQKKLKDFITQALFLEVTNNNQLAEVFQKSGLQGLAELYSKKPQKLVDIVEEGKEKGLIKKSITLDEAFEIQKKAIETKFTTVFYGILKDKNNKGIANANIYLNNRETITNEEGKFFVSRIEYGKHKIFIDAKGFNQILFIKNFQLTKKVSDTIILTKGDKKINRKNSNTINPGDKFKTLNLAIDDVSVNDQYYITKLYKNGSIGLRSIQQKQNENAIYTNKIKVLPVFFKEKDIELKNTFEWNGNKFVKLSKTFLELRMLTNKI